MMNTLSCPTCQYTLHGDEPEIITVCDICKLVDEVASLSVSDLWKFIDGLKAKESEGLYNYDGIKSRIKFLEEDV